MSTNLVNEIELSIGSTEVTVKNSEDITASSTHCVNSEHVESIVKGYKKEYSIVGDGLYASTSSSDAPVWLTSIIDSTVETAVSKGMVNYDTLVQDVHSAISSIDVASNTFVKQINFNTTVNSIINSKLETLNTSLDDKFATKTALGITSANSTEALAQTTEALQTALNDKIRAATTSIQEAYAADNTALAENINAISVSFDNQIKNQTANAAATSGLKTYVGLGSEGEPDGSGLLASMQAMSEFSVDLKNAIAGADGNTTTSINNFKISSTAYTDKASTDVENKFSYNAKVVLYGNYYTSGFGLTSTGTTGSGTDDDPFNSEFWINAEKLKFTNSSQTGTKAPFTIDASGSTPNITFNGNVGFQNLSGWEDTLAPDGLSSDGKTIISGDRITTGVIKTNDLDTVDPTTIDPSEGYTGTIIDKEGMRVYENGILRVKIGDIS